MNVGLIVEDYYAEAVKEICRKISINPEVRRQRGRISVRKASSYAKELLYDCEKVIILADAHCNPEGEKKRLGEVYNLLPDALRGCVQICIVVHELESWLLADEDALSRFLGRDVKVKAIANPEEIHDAKDYLDAIFKKAGKTYLTRMAKEIACSTNVDKIAKKSSSFADFRNKAGDCYV